MSELRWRQSSINERKRQLLDAAGIWAVQKKQLDIEYMLRWARTLQVAPELAHIRRGEIRPKVS
jgi:hypothetical protein